MCTPPSSNRQSSRAATYRSRQRARSHHALHDESAEDQGTPRTLIDHALVPAGEPELISTQEAADALVAELQIAANFAFDTEFIGEETYHPRLCLVQVATTRRVALLDPMAGLDLRGFWSLVAQDGVEKVVHAGMQDLEPVVRHVDQPPRRVFDTQLAAGFAGLAYPLSLDKLVRTLVGVDPARGAKFSQWDRRPLTSVQLRYAANDVRFLPLLRHLLAERLEALGNTDYAQARCEELCERSLYQSDVQSQRLRVRSLDWMSPRQRTVLRALLQWRDQAAREEDVPPRALLRDDLLVELARTPRRTLPELAQVRGLPRPLQRQHGQNLLRWIERALDQPINDHDDAQIMTPRRDDPSATEAWSRVASHCRQRGIDPAVLISKRDFLTHWQAVRSGQDSPVPRLQQGWRRRLLDGLLNEVSPHPDKGDTM